MNDKITPTESFWLWVMRRNANTPRIEFRRRWRLPRLEITFCWRSRNNLWGRFGGGWNWKLGFQAGGKTLFVYLLVASLQFTIKAGE